MTKGNSMNIKQIRQAKGISQKQFAIDMGVSQPVVCEWQKGKKYPSSKHILQIAEYFGVSVQQVLGTEETDIEKLQQTLQLDPYVINLLSSLSKNQLQRVIGYAEGLLASSKG